MLVVSILLIFIILITLILIFGGRDQRRANKMMEKERKEAIKSAKKEMKNEHKERKSEYTDLLKDIENEDLKEENDKDYENIVSDTFKENDDNTNINENSFVDDMDEENIRSKFESELYKNNGQEKEIGATKLRDINGDYEEDFDYSKSNEE